MAVYERTYKRYVGALTPQWSRFLVLPRYAFQDVFRSKPLIAFLALSVIVPLISAVMIYLRHNADMILAVVPNFPIDQFLKIDVGFFDRLMGPQFVFAFFITLFIGPGLVSRDLANNGLPLYLSRPFTRTDYVLGKFAVLGILLSAVTWIPGLAIFALQSGYAGWGWLADHVRIAMAIFVGSWVVIITLGLLALAISAWVKWRPIAGAVMFMLFLAGGFFGALVNVLFRTEWGNLVNLGLVLNTVWHGLLGKALPAGISVSAAWLAILLFAGFCVLLLSRKIRAYEVVR